MSRRSVKQALQGKRVISLDEAALLCEGLDIDPKSTIEGVFEQLEGASAIKQRIESSPWP